MTRLKTDFTAIVTAAASFFRHLPTGANKHTGPVDRSRYLPLVRRRPIPLNRRARRSKVVLARVPKILRWCRTSNGHSHGRLSV